ncbi:MAG: class II aldolase/adducin family protein [Bacillota bacterium]|nr:class II aldolase/adducin family protein [Bacillota bacterium]
MLDEMKSQLVEVAKLAYKKGMVNTYEGNLSVRKGDFICITPSGVSKGLLNEDMISVIDLDGRIIEGSCKPSSEWRLHALSYINRTDINAVIHAHSPYTTAYAIANKAIETKAYPEMIVFFDKIPLADYGTQATDEIFDGVKKYIPDHDAILLANHGIITIGKDIYDTFYRLEAAESIAKALILSEFLGGGKDLPQAKIDELYEIRRNKIKNSK